MSFEILYFCISSITILFLAKIYYDLMHLKAIVQDKVLNHIPQEIIKLVYCVTKSLDEGIPDKAIREYITAKGKTVTDHYHFLRSTRDFSYLYKTDFVTAFLGNGELELKKMYDRFPDDFLMFVDMFNERVFKNFRENLTVQISTTKNNNERWESFKTLLLTSLEENMSGIVERYKSIKNKIEDEGFVVGEGII